MAKSGSGVLREKNEELFADYPLLSIQTMATKSSSLCCGYCGKYLMNWQVQVCFLPHLSFTRSSNLIHLIMFSS
jgi:hypothetical protein